MFAAAKISNFYNGYTEVFKTFPQTLWKTVSYCIYQFSLQVISKETSQGCLKVQSIDTHAHKRKKKKAQK